ncbi:hypothetical protein OsI_03404 [Oryza sativa Indica Group]|uniref:Uncharacterized protein n=1 Tax=Oryza sativa subsp. indica TaxID=39946 RepID=A2WU59_ORYSI|nr:hypothetical protein OsI_03404 [Oryza sativa Indica Group]
MDACVFLMLWCVGAVDVSEDSMESSEEMVTPRAAASEADEEERKAATSEVPVEVVEAGEEVMVDALPPEAAAGAQEQQGKAEALVVVQEPEVKREELVAKVHPMHDPEPQGEEVLVVEAAAVSAVQEPEVKRDEVVVMETAAPPAVQESETKSGGVLVNGCGGGVTGLWVQLILQRWPGDLQWLWLQQGSGQHGGIAVGYLMRSLVRRDRLRTISMFVNISTGPDFFCRNEGGTIAAFMPFYS